MTQDNPPYHDTVRFDADFKKRQKEIKDEIVAWSGSKEFSRNCEEVVKKVLQNHDEVKGLSNRLLENAPFISKIKDLTREETENYIKQKWWERKSKWWWMLVAAASTSLFGFLGSWLFSKLISQS